MKIYVASSWRNALQPAIVHALRRSGHEVYDFRHPPDGSAFSWKETANAPAHFRTGGHLQKEWVHGQAVSPEIYKAMLSHPLAVAGYASDIKYVRECDAIVYVLPCGRSASWEFGYAMGQGKPGYVVAFDDTEPELMFMEAKILVNMGELFDVFGEPVES